MTKINDSFEYPEVLNLRKYLSESNNDELFSLHSVVVHKGSINSGHYYSFIRPTLNDSWIKFNDEMVFPASKAEVFENNYGGIFNNYTLSEKEIYENKMKKDSNAYILIYIQNSMRSIILEPLDIENDV